MGKEFKNIDELYQAELGNRPIEAPSHVKKNIDEALGFNSNKRGFFLIGLSVLAIFGVIVAFVVHFGESHKPFSQAALTVNAQGQVPVSKNRNLTLGDYTLVNSINENTASELSPALDEKSVQQNRHSTSHSNLTSSSNNNPNSITTTATDRSATKDKKNGTNRSTTSLNGSTQEKDLALIEANKATGNTKKDTDKNNNPTVNLKSKENETNAASTSHDIASTQEFENSNPLLAEPLTDETTSDLAENQTIENTSNPSAELDLSDLPEPDEDDKDDENAEKNEIPATPPTTIDPAEKKAYKPMMISLTSGINILKSAYTSSSMTEKTIYDNATTDRIGNQTNLDLTYRLKNGLALGTGVGFVNYVEDYQFKITNITYDTIETVDYVYDTSGVLIDSIIVFTPVPNENTTNYNGKNKASYFILPVHFGTEILWKKFQFDVFATARFNFLMRSSGGYLSNNGLQLFDQSNSIYKPYFVDIMLGTRVHYNLIKNIYLTGSIKYRPVIGSTLTNVSFNKSFDYIHLGLGLSLKF